MVSEEAETERWKWKGVLFYTKKGAPTSFLLSCPFLLITNWEMKNGPLRGVEWVVIFSRYFFSLAIFLFYFSLLIFLVVTFLSISLSGASIGVIFQVCFCFSLSVCAFPKTYIDRTDSYGISKPLLRRPEIFLSNLFLYK